MSETPVPERAVTHTHIGGQALLEGVMMRGRYNWAVAVRTPGGEIHTEEHELRSAAKKHAWMRKPVIRGVVALVETLSLAMKAFGISAAYAGEDEEEQLSGRDITLSMIFGAVLAVGLFIALPAGLAWLVVRDSNANPLAWNAVNGAVRVLVFFAYIWAISRLEDIQRVFAYHGAEHKVIHAYEHGLPLETPVIQRYSTQHVRCGTSFLLMVMVVAVIVFSLVPVAPLARALGIEAQILVRLLTILVHIALLPVVAGLAYEITVKWAGSRPDNPVVRVMLWPGLQLQRMTTREPDDSMIEVAVESMRLVVARELAEEAASDA